MKRILQIIFLLACLPMANGQTFEDIGKAVPYVRALDTILSLDPMSPDSFVRIQPGSVYALKGEYMEVTTVYTDGRPEEVNFWYEARRAGKVSAPELPPPPIAKLPRDGDGWLNLKAYQPVGVSFSEAAEDIQVYLPFFETNEMDGGDFFQIFESKEQAFVADAVKKYVDKNTFKLAFENGKEKIVGDSVLGTAPNLRKIDNEYLGHYPTLGVYLLESIEGKLKQYHFVSRRDGSLLASVSMPWALPAVSPDAQWLVVSSGTTDLPIHYLRFYQRSGDSFSEKFTVRMPFQKIVACDWEDNENLLLRVVQDNPVETGKGEERYYRAFLRLSKQ